MLGCSSCLRHRHLLCIVAVLASRYAQLGWGSGLYPGLSKIPEVSIPVSILSASESELVSADRIDTVPKRFQKIFSEGGWYHRNKVCNPREVVNDSIKSISI